MQAIFLESICDDASLVDRNIREKVRTSPDYADWLDKEAAVRDLESRIANYQKVSPLTDENRAASVERRAGTDDISLRFRPSRGERTQW